MGLSQAQSGVVPRDYTGETAAGCMAATGKKP